MRLLVILVAREQGIIVETLVVLVEKSGGILVYNVCYN